MSKWKVCKLGEVAEIVGGGTPKTEVSEYWNGEIAWLTPRDLSNFNGRYISKGERNISKLGLAKSSAKILPKGTVLLSSRAPVGYLAIAKNEVSTNQGFRNLIPNSETDNLFLFYLLKNNVEYLKSQAAGTTFGELAGSTLKSLSFLFPPLPEQRAIAHILGTLDDKIELNRRMNETLEQMARAIFKSWFVDFEPVRAKMSGRWKKGESLPGLPAHLWDLFPDRLVSSALGEIPEGWEISTVGREANIIKGVSYRSKELLESKTAMVTLKSFNRGGGYRPDGLKPYIGDFRKEQIIQPGELIVAQTDVTQAAAVIGKPALVLPDKHFTTLVASLDVLIIRPKTNDLSTEFFYLLFLTSEFEDHIRRHTNGTTVLHLGKNGMPSFRFIKPPPHITYYFSEHVKSIFKQIRMNFEESVVVASLRDTLLPRLINGKM